MNNNFTYIVRTCSALLLLVGYLLTLSGQTSKTDSTQVFGLIIRAHEALRIGHTIELASRLDSLEGLQNSLTRRDWKVTALCALSEINSQLGDFSKAESFSQRGLDILRDAPTDLPDTLADLLYFLHATSQLEQGEWDEFALYIDSSFQILHKLPEPDPIREARNAIRMSFLTYNQGNLSKTIEWTKTGIDQMLAVDLLTTSDSNQLASLYSNIAFLNDASGRFDDVVPNYNYALQYNPTLIAPYINQAVLLRSTQPMRSIELSKQVLQIIPVTTYHDRCNAYSNIVSSSLVLAAALEDTAHYDAALQYHDSILAMSPLAGPKDYPFAANSHGLFADYYSRVAKSRDLDQASFHLQQNMDLMRNFQSKSNTRGLKHIQSSWKARLARISILRGDFLTADKALKEVNWIYQNEEQIQADEFPLSSEFLLNNSSTLEYPLTYLSNLIGWSGQLDDPMEKLIEADQVYQIVDSTYDELLRKNELEVEHLHFDRLHTRGVAIAIHKYEATGHFDHLREAHARIEKLFSLDLFQNHVQARLKNSTDDESAIYREKLILREEIDLLIRQNADEPSQKKRLDSLNQAYITVVEKLGTSYQTKSETSADQITLDELKKQLAPDEAMLYFLYDKISALVYGLCITQDTVVPIRKHIEDLEALVYKTNLALVDPNSTTYKEQLKKLYAVFIGPIQELVEGKQLTICSMGKLELVPYDLLLDSEENYLCFQHPIRHIYSAGWNRKDPGPNSSGAIYGYTSSPKNAVAAVVRGGEEFTNLKAAREEIEYLRAEFNARVFVDKKSTKQVFQNTADEASVLHLAMHSVVNPLEPLKSRIVFDHDGNDQNDLHYHEIDDLNIGAQLVTLSACNSGKGNFRGAGSIASLARAFNYAGCPNVVQTLWSVNDESSLDLMKAFYHNLRDGQTVPSALATAKKQFFDSAPEKWKHPYYWGGYIYNGQDITIDLKEKRSLWLYIFPGGLIALFMIVFFFTNRAD